MDLHFSSLEPSTLWMPAIQNMGQEACGKG